MSDEGEATARADRQQTRRRPPPPTSSNQPPRQQHAEAHPAANVDAYKEGKTRDSIGERAVVASKAINLIRRVKFHDLTPTAWDLLQRNLDSVVTYIKDIEEERKKTRENTDTNPNMNQAKEATKTWAAMAAQASATPPPAPNAEENTGGRRLRELVIRVEDENEREDSKTMLAEHILQKVQSTKHAETSQLVAARRLQSGDILSQAATVESRERLERNPRWEKLLCQSAKILRQTFPILMHGVRRDAVSPGHEKEALDRIQRENEKYHPGLEILKVSWPKWARGDKDDGTPKQYSSLLVELNTPEAANSAVEKGMYCSASNAANTVTLAPDAPTTPNVEHVLDTTTQEIMKTQQRPQLDAQYAIKKATPRSTQNAKSAKKRRKKLEQS
ncbi:hypothetical protein MMC07_004528 [Pseudocyphellaria aurata]|nr:hypothetical protein [Pseudocyphellaria aurata]